MRLDNLNTWTKDGLLLNSREEVAEAFKEMRRLIYDGEATVLRPYAWSVDYALHNGAGDSDGDYRAKPGQLTIGNVRVTDIAENNFTVLDRIRGLGFAEFREGFPTTVWELRSYGQNPTIKVTDCAFARNGFAPTNDMPPVVYRHDEILTHVTHYAILRLHLAQVNRSYTLDEVADKCAITKFDKPAMIMPVENSLIEYVTIRPSFVDNKLEYVLHGPMTPRTLKTIVDNSYKEGSRW